VSVTDTISGPKNQITGKKIKVMNGETMMRDWMLDVNYYDNKYRIIQIVGDNQINGSKDIVSTKYSFTGRIEAQEVKDSTFSTVLDYTERFNYDHRGRMIEHTVEGLPNSGKVMVESMKYDNSGQLITKLNHSEYSSGGYNPFIQKTDYRYNIRRCLKGINNPDSITTENDIFSMNFFYNDSLSGISSPRQYNGNISSVQWKTNENNNQYAYRYSYDSLNRLKEGVFYQKTNGPWIHNNSFDEKHISYDPNGNIMTLDRYAAGSRKIDQLHYYYLNNGNQVDHITDSIGDVAGIIDYQGDNTSTSKYAYDLNGNMTIDKTKGINTPITYSFLNKPEQLDFGNGEKIQYIYDGTGQKLAKKVLQGNAVMGSSLIYADKFIYDWNGVLQYILNGEGRLVPDGNTFRYEYYCKDHLGNNRATYAPVTPGLAQVIEYQHYYPFGMQMVALCSNTGTDVPNRYLYNGKELQTDFGLQWYDYGVRFYDPQLVRWYSLDPLAEKNRRWSPYNYCNNNPIYYIDPIGKSGVAYLTVQKNKEEKPIVKVVSNVYIYGVGATDANAQSIQSNALALYNNDGNYFNANIGGVDYEVQFEINVQVIDQVNVDAKLVEGGYSNLNAENNFYEIRDDIEDAGQTLSGVYGGNTGVIKTSEVGTPTPSHELNHGYGGIDKDRIDNTILSENDIAVQGNNSAAPANRKVTQGNIDAIFKNVDFKGGNKANVGNARPQLFDKEKGYRQVPQK